MWCFLSLNHKPQPFYFAAVLRSGGHDINAGGFNAAVAKDVCQLGDVLLDAVKRPGEEFAQIVGEHLGRAYFGRSAQAFHL